jgi:hypothetical protein
MSTSPGNKNVSLDFDPMPAFSSGVWRWLPPNNCDSFTTIEARATKGDFVALSNDDMGEIQRRYDGRIYETSKEFGDLR